MRRTTPLACLAPTLPCIATVLTLMCMSSSARADEGMWTYNALPLRQLEAKWHFKPPAGWADHLMRASLRIAQGCSASFVSPHGLIMTNQHCARACALGLSTAGSDLVGNGFIAATEEKERRCPDLEIDQLVSIMPETETMRAATKGLDGAVFEAAERRAQEKLEAACSKTEAMRCDLVSLFHGGKYDLYIYKKYTDIRLAFIAEDRAANFGDPNSADWPYHDFDVSFLRVYEQGRPADSWANYLQSSKQMLKPGDLVFTGGNPANTERLDTVAELEAQRDVVLPSAVEDTAELYGMAAEAARHDAEMARQFQDILIQSENQVGRLRKQHDALSTGDILENKRREEADLRAKVAAVPALQAKFGDAWAETANAASHEREIAGTYLSIVVVGEELPFARLWSAAMAIALHAEESAKPDSQRLPEMQDAAWPQTRDAVLSPAPMDHGVEERMLLWTLSRLKAQTSTSHPLYRTLIGDEGESAIAARLVAGTKLFDAAERRRLVEGGAAAVTASTDPLLVYIRDKFLPAMLPVRKDWDDNIDGVYRRNAALIDQARLATGGNDVAPDATSTPRLAFGAVKGYRWYGADMPVWTTIGEAFGLDRPSDPFQLPKTWRVAKTKLPMNMKLDFVADVDAVGGNSGSPVVDRTGNLVGLCFAINDAGEHNTFANDPQASRTINVSWVAITTMLRDVYGAQSLVDEMTR
jgi:hypothetical protein